MDYTTTHFRRVLFIKIYEARGLPKGKGYYCTISLGDRIWRTKTTWKDDNIYGDEFTLELSNARDPISIHVFKDRSKKSDRRVGRIEISTNIMRKSFAFDRWVPLLEMNDKLSKGELRLKLQYDVRIAHMIHLSTVLTTAQEDVILPTTMYTDFSELILREDLSTVKLIEKLARDKYHIGKFLAAIFAAQQQAEKLLSYLVLKEVMVTDNPSTLFRSGSFATKAIEFVLKTFGQSYLLTVVKPILVALTQSEQSCEIDRNKMEAGEDIFKNIEQLKIYVNLAIDRIFNSLQHFPLLVRKILRNIHTNTVFKFPQRESVHFSAVGGTLFLRFIIPIFLSPWQVLCEVDDPVPSSKQLRNMTLVGTVLQKLANMQLFTHQEMPYLELNPVLESHFEMYKTFVEATISVPDIEEKEYYDGKTINADFHLTDLLNFLIDQKATAEALPDKEAEELLEVISTLQLSIEKERKRLEGMDKLRSGPIGRNQAGSAAAHVASVDRLVEWLVEGGGNEGSSTPELERSHSRSSPSSPALSKKRERRSPSVVEIFGQPVMKTKSTPDLGKAIKERREREKEKRKEKDKGSDKEKDKDKERGKKGRSNSGSPKRNKYKRSLSSKSLHKTVDGRLKTSNDESDNEKETSKRSNSPGKEKENKRHSSPGKRALKGSISTGSPTKAIKRDQTDDKPPVSWANATFDPRLKKSEDTIDTQDEPQSMPVHSILMSSSDVPEESTLSSSSSDVETKPPAPVKESNTNRDESVSPRKASEETVSPRKGVEEQISPRKAEMMRSDSQPIRRPALSAPLKHKLSAGQNSLPSLKAPLQKVLLNPDLPSSPRQIVAVPKSLPIKPPSPGSARTAAETSKISLVTKRDTTVRSCQYCKEEIVAGKDYLEYKELTFHPHHFLCATCGIDLKFLGFSLFRDIPVCRFCFDKLKKAEDTARCSSCGEDLKEETESGKVWALNRWWHNRCFKCHGCSGEFVNGNYFSGPNNAPYCKTCVFLGRVKRGNAVTLSAKPTTPLSAKQAHVCVECFRPINGEMYVAMGNKYHPEHFKCDVCDLILKEGNYVLANGKKMCPTH